MKFYDTPLEMQKEISKEPVATIDELRLLKAQINLAIRLIELELIVPMSESERLLHASRFGHGAFVIGDFVIRKI